VLRVILSVRSGKDIRSVTVSGAEQIAMVLLAAGVASDAPTALDGARQLVPELMGPAFMRKRLGTVTLTPAGLPTFRATLEEGIAMALPGAQAALIASERLWR